MSETGLAMTSLVLALISSGLNDLDDAAISAFSNVALGSETDSGFEVEAEEEAWLCLTTKMTMITITTTMKAMIAASGKH